MVWYWTRVNCFRAEDTLNTCKITGIVLRIQDFEVTLNLEEARALRDTLDNLLGKSSGFWDKPQIVYDYTLNSG